MSRHPLKGLTISCGKWIKGINNFNLYPIIVYPVCSSLHCTPLYPAPFLPCTPLYLAPLFTRVWNNLHLQRYHQNIRQYRLAKVSSTITSTNTLRLLLLLPESVQNCSVASGRLVNVRASACFLVSDGSMSIRWILSNFWNFCGLSMTVEAFSFGYRSSRNGPLLDGRRSITQWFFHICRNRNITLSFQFEHFYVTVFLRFCSNCSFEVSPVYNRVQQSTTEYNMYNVYNRVSLALNITHSLEQALVLGQGRF